MSPSNHSIYINNVTYIFVKPKCQNSKIVDFKFCKFSKILIAFEDKNGLFKQKYRIRFYKFWIIISIFTFSNFLEIFYFSFLTFTFDFYVIN